MGCHALLQGIFPTQGSNPRLPHWRRILYHLSHQERWVEGVLNRNPGFLTASPLFFPPNFKLLILYWGIADQQRWGDSSRLTVKRLSRTYTGIHSPLNAPPIQAATSHWAGFHVLNSRSLLVMHFKYSSVYMSLPNSQSIPSPREPWVRFLSLWVSFCFARQFICTISF